MADKTVSQTYAFRGMEYIVTMTTEEESMLTVEVEDRLSADQWRGTFDAAYLEDLTHKTGNYKQFQIFVNMLESAVTQSSDSVSLDLLTYSDLESLRKSTTSSKNIPKASRNQTLNSKRYLILTYTVEFDRIHYPLPLPYVGKPDPRALQDTIRELRQEIKALRTHGSKDYRHKELEKLKRDYDRLLQEKEDLESAFVDFRREVGQTSVGHATKEVRVLKDLVKTLEEDLLSEQTKHQRATTRRSTEHRRLIAELDEAKTNERNLRSRLKSVTNELALFKRRGNHSRVAANTSGSSSHRRVPSYQNSLLNNGHSSRENSFNSRVSRNSANNSYNSRNRSLERSRERSLSRGRSTERPAYLRDRSRERPLSSSRERPLSRERGRDRSRDSIGSVRSRGRSPAGSGVGYPRFDPTAYIKDKQRKKETNPKGKGRPPTSLSGNYDRKPKTSISGPFDRRPRSRNSSIGSLRSRTSSIESLSDVGLASDASAGRLQKTRKVLKTKKALNAWSSPDVSFNSKTSSRKPSAKTIKSNKILSSTPETQRTRTKNHRKENIVTSDAGGDSDYFDRSSEIGEIDARLNRLQQFMENNLC